MIFKKCTVVLLTDSTPVKYLGHPASQLELKKPVRSETNNFKNLNQVQLPLTSTFGITMTWVTENLYGHVRMIKYL